MFRKFILRVLFSPLSLVYGIVISVINFFYNIGLLKGSSFSIPVIGIGNLSIGGTGKTPHIEYLIELLKDYIDLATLSRGYKRKTQGFRFVQSDDTALTVGDEPLQYRRKYREIIVAASESRAYAIPQILQTYPATQAILLDDAFQHRGVKPGLNILLTAYNALFTNDFLLPSGRLREWRSGYKRADIIIVTKCPLSLAIDDRISITAHIRPLKNQKVYFSKYVYGYPFSFYQPEQKISLDKNLDIVLLSAVASTEYLLDYLFGEVNSVHEMEYEDHHNFDEYDIDKICQIFENNKTKRLVLITTEKDAMRLEIHKTKLQKNQIPVFVLPIKVSFCMDDGKLFDDDIRKFLLDFEV